MVALFQQGFTLYSLTLKAVGDKRGIQILCSGFLRETSYQMRNPTYPCVAGAYTSPDILKYCPFSSAGGNCSPWPWAVSTQPTGYEATDTCHLHLSWPLSQFCHMHKPRLSKEYQDGKVTKSGQPWQPRQTSFQSHFLNTHIEQTRTGPFQIAHTSTLCYRGTLLPFIRKLMTGNIQLN